MLRTRSFVTITLLLAVVAAAAATPARMRIDRNHSTIGFSVPIMAGMSSVTGKFTDFEIELDWDAENPDNSAVSATIQAASIDTGIDGRDEHLRTADFFDVENHPAITFASETVAIEGNTGTVSGTLTIRGTSRPATLELQLMPTPDGGLGVRATTTFDRTDFGVQWQHREIPMFVGHDVTAEFFVLASAPRE